MDASSTTPLYELIEQCMKDSKRWFPDVSGDAFFTALAMCGEAGEVANILKKVARGSCELEQVREDIAEECVDVLIYLCMMFGTLGIDPINIYNRKRAFNEGRFGSGIIDAGPGDRIVLPDPTTSTYSAQHPAGAGA